METDEELDGEGQVTGARGKQLFQGRKKWLDLWLDLRVRLLEQEKKSEGIWCMDRKRRGNACV